MNIQHLLPKHLLSRLGRHIAECDWPWFKNRLIKYTIKHYNIDMNEAADTLENYAHFNAFFTRKLKPEARPINQEKSAITSPCDGQVMSFGDIQKGTLLQAKDKAFSLKAFVADPERYKPFEGGQYIVTYLSPRDYHRVHMPYAGTLTQTSVVPGSLYSVNPECCEEIDGLLAKNERMVAHFDTDIGPIAVTMVGACLVGSIYTRWAGTVTPNKSHWVDHTQNADTLLAYDKGEEIGHFKFGSTVVLLLPKAKKVDWAELTEGCSVKMGQTLATLVRPKPAPVRLDDTPPSEEEGIENTADIDV